MSFFNSMNISASGLTAQRLRMDVISQNIANATTTRTAHGGPYQRRVALFESVPSRTFDTHLDEAFAFNPIDRTLNRTFPGTVEMEPRGRQTSGGGVRVSGIDTDTTTGPLVYDPNHPHANEAGYVEMPNVNIVVEMVNMMSASRSYEANMTAINTTRAMITRTLELGQGR